MKVSRICSGTLVGVLLNTPVFAKDGQDERSHRGRPAPSVQSQHSIHSTEDVTRSSEFDEHQPQFIELTSPAKLPKRWYGWQTLTTDGVAIASFVLAGYAEEATVLPTVGLGTYIIGGPIVHASHDNWGRAGISSGMRVGLPLVAGGALYAVSSCGTTSDAGEVTADGWCELGRALVALFSGAVGATVASALDASLLAWEPTEVEPQVSPALGVNKTSAWLGVAGQF